MISASKVEVTSQGGEQTREVHILHGCNVELSIRGTDTDCIQYIDNDSDSELHDLV